jgi:hypothetical protein
MHYVEGEGDFINAVSHSEIPSVVIREVKNGCLAASKPSAHEHNSGVWSEAQNSSDIPHPTPFVRKPVR